MAKEHWVYERGFLATKSCALVGNYIKSGNKADLDLIKACLRNNIKTLLVDVSAVSGNSLFHYIFLTIPFSSPDSAKRLFDVFCDLSPDDLSALLHHANIKGNLVSHDVAMSAPDKINVFFDFLEYFPILKKEIMRSINSNNDSILSCVLFKGNTKAFDRIKREDLGELYSEINNAGVSAYQQSLMTCDDQIVRAVYQETYQLYKEKVIGRESYLRIAYGENNAGHSCLLSALGANNKVLMVFLGYFEDDVDSDFIDENMAATMLLSTNKNGYNGFHCALNSTDKENVTWFIMQLEKFRSAISDEQRKKLVLQKTSKHYNILHLAAMRDNLEGIEAIFVFINQSFDEEEAKAIKTELLHGQTDLGRKPESRNRKINVVLNNLRERLPQLEHGQVHGYH